MRVSLWRHRAGVWLASSAVVALGILGPSTAGAQAATVTVGSPLTAAFGAGGACSEGCTVTNLSLPEPGALVTSPITGTIVRWRLIGASAIPGYAIRVLNPTGGPFYTDEGTGPSETPNGISLQTFTSALPIKAGDLVGLNVPVEGSFGEDPVPSATFGGWIPALPTGATLPIMGPLSDEIAFNADVQPPPGVSSLNPASGSTQGGTSVEITGHDLTGASAVKFGPMPVSNFSVDSETKVTAVAPAATASGAVDVTVTTAAGTSEITNADQFAYEVPAVATKGPPPSTIAKCIVPRLKGKSLKSANKVLTRANCKLGKVKGKQSKDAKVESQSPKPGTVLRRGSKVNARIN
jgi:IPT/TIG domain/PASTA domain